MDVGEGYNVQVLTRYLAERLSKDLGLRGQRAKLLKLLEHFLRSGSNFSH